MINSTKKLSDNKNKKTTILIGMIFLILGFSIGSTQISSQMVAYAQEEVNDSKSQTMKIILQTNQPNKNNCLFLY